MERNTGRTKNNDDGDDDMNYRYIIYVPIYNIYRYANIVVI